MNDPKPDPIPSPRVEAAARALYEAQRIEGGREWERVKPSYQRLWIAEAEAVLSAADAAQPDKSDDREGAFRLTRSAIAAMRDIPWGDCTFTDATVNGVPGVTINLDPETTLRVWRAMIDDALKDRA